MIFRVGSNQTRVPILGYNNMAKITFYAWEAKLTTRKRTYNMHPATPIGIRIVTKSAQDATQQICLPPLQVTVYCLHMHGLSFMNTT